jgi:hypothetical protein
MSPAGHPHCRAPGIVVITGKGAGTAASDAGFEQLLADDWTGPQALRASARHGGWLLAGVVGRGPRDACEHRRADGVTVLFDGYLTAVAGPDGESLRGRQGAEVVADLYRRHGVAFLPWLRGSFAGLIIDGKADSVLLFTDRAGSRPLFVRPLKSGIAIAPRVRFLARLEPERPLVNARAVGEFLLRGCFYGDDTLFEGIAKIGQAEVVKLSPGALMREKYWRPGFVSADRRSEDDLIDEFDDRIRTGVRRLASVAQRPALLLSGGVDSRIMLAALLQERIGAIAAVSYAVAGTDGDDHLIARSLAEEHGLAHETYLIRPEDFVGAAAKEVLAADGRVQMIDAPSSRWEHIGASFDAMWIGDECFGWKGDATSPGEALDLVGWWNLNMAQRVADWLRPAVKLRIREEISSVRQRLAEDPRGLSPNDLKDTLYFSQRMGNLLNGYHARRLNVCEQLRPFLDEDLIDFVARLPNALRIDKALAVKLMQRKYPALHARPYARKTSVPWRPPQFAKLMASDPELARFVVEGLGRRLDVRLQGLIDEARLQAALAAIVAGARLPPLRGQWWVRLPGLWRYAADRNDGVHPVQGALRLLNLNLYLAAC